MSLSNAHNWRAAPAYIAAATFVAASAATNISFAIHNIPEPVRQAVAGAIAASVAVTLALAIPATLKAIGNRQTGRALVCAVAALVCGTYSVAAALGANGGQRIDTAASATDTSARTQRAKLAYDMATAELAAEAPARVVAELDQLMAGKRISLRGEACNGDTSKAAVTICRDLANLSAEAARAAHRTELAKAVAATGAALDAIKPAQTANADAATLASIAGALGYTIDASKVALVLTILSVIVLELGGGLSLAVAAALSSDAPTSKREPTDAELATRMMHIEQITAAATLDPSGVSLQILTDPVRAPIKPAVRAGRKQAARIPAKQAPAQPAVAKAQADIIDLVRSRDGTVTTSVRGLAKLLEGAASKSTVATALGGLIASGVLIKAGDALILAQQMRGAA